MSRDLLHERGSTLMKRFGSGGTDWPDVRGRDPQKSGEPNARIFELLAAPDEAVKINGDAPPLARAVDHEGEAQPT
jgi:hypothetical protein